MLITPNDGETIQRVSDETFVSNTGVANTQMRPTTVGTDVSVFTQMGSHNPPQFHLQTDACTHE